MGNPRERWVRWAGLILGAVFLARYAFILFRPDPLSRIQIPPVPRWAPTNAAAGAGTNALVKATGSNLTSGVGTSTNRMTNNRTGQVPTNSVAQAPASLGTNWVGSSTNPPSVANPLAGSNRVPIPGAPLPVMAGPPPGMMPGRMPGMPGMPGMPPGMGPRVPLPPLVQARVDKIVQSELLGPVIRPMPMGLLGIAGPDVFLRTPNGQRVILREGETADGVKLLRVGINRVLVEHTNETKELMIFSGSGGESLLPKSPAAKP